MNNVRSIATKSAFGGILTLLILTLAWLVVLAHELDNRLDAISVAPITPTIESMMAMNARDGDNVRVMDSMRGGEFIFNSTLSRINDEGLVFNGWVRQFSGPLNVLWFGADPKYIRSSTKAFNSALQIAKGNSSEIGAVKQVFVPAGTYLISQIVIPSGVDFFGAGTGHFGLNETESATVLRQEPGVEDDAVIFDTTESGGFQRVFNGAIRDMIIRGPDNGTIGNGINFRRTGERTSIANHAIIGGQWHMENVLIRGFPENGVLNRAGAVGEVVFRRTAGYFNGGYAIRVDGEIALRSFVCEHCGGDGNSGGAAIYLASRADESIANVLSLYGEYRENLAFGPTNGFTAAQPYAIEIGDFAQNGVVNVFGGVVVTNVAGEKPEAGLLVSSTSQSSTPTINIVGFQVWTGNRPGNNGYLLKDLSTGETLPRSVKTATYYMDSGVKGIAEAAQDVSIGGEYKRLPFVSGGGLQVVGTSPKTSLYETDAVDGEKAWYWVANSGELTLRTASDNGEAGTIGVYVRRSGTAFAQWTFDMPVRLRKGSVDDYSELSIEKLPVFPDDSAATLGGLSIGRIYQTLSGELRIKL